MSSFVDTSFFIALLDEDDEQAPAAAALWRQASAAHLPVFTTNYVVLEACAVFQRRLGPAAVRMFVHELLAPVDLEWVTRDDHERAVEALRVADRRRLSLVDCTSFEVMRRMEAHECLAFDRHFAEQGFAVVAG